MLNHQSETGSFALRIGSNRLTINQSETGIFTLSRNNVGDEAWDPKQIHHSGNVKVSAIQNKCMDYGRRKCNHFLPFRIEMLN